MALVRSIFMAKKHAPGETTRVGTEMVKRIGIGCVNYLTHDSYNLVLIFLDCVMAKPIKRLGLKFHRRCYAATGKLINFVDGYPPKNG